MNENYCLNITRKLKESNNNNNKKNDYLDGNSRGVRKKLT
jgi:hypothetical protein